MRSLPHILSGLLAIMISIACEPTDLIEDPGVLYTSANLGFGAAYSSGGIRQWTPVNLVITLSDKEGRDLLSPERRDNYFEGATLSFMGQTYTAQDESQHEPIAIKAYQPSIYGYFLVQQETRYCLLFGEIDGAEDLDEDIVLNWRDGSTDTIHYHCTKHNQKDMTCQRSWKLNGKSVNGPSFSLVK